MAGSRCSVALPQVAQNRWGSILCSKKMNYFFLIEDAKIFLTFLGTDFRASDRRSDRLADQIRGRSSQKNYQDRDQRSVQTTEI